MAGSSRVALRSAWSVLGLGVALIGLLLAAGYLWHGTPPTAAEYGLAALLGVPSAWAVVRVPMMRVVLEPDRLVYHGLFRTRAVLPGEIAAIELVGTGNVTGEARAPVLRLTSGRTVVLGAVATYGRRRASDLVDELTLWWRRAAPGDGAAADRG